MAREANLIPPFLPGELVTIQRTVEGDNVLMVVKVREPCTLTTDRLTLTGQLRNWGKSSYADGRVAQQAASIERLLNHLQRHCVDSDCPHLGVAE